MKTAEIPDKVVLKGALFTGTYTKRKMKTAGLYCWFNESMVHFPHASINITPQDPNWVDFHVSFPITIKKGAWEEGSLEVSYSVYVRIDPKTDQLSVTETSDTRHWEPTGTNPGFKGFADADRRGLAFAKEFYSAAFIGSM